MTLLNSRWENLRVASMDRQSRLHEVLMDLQQQQLQQLSDWLTTTEGRIRKMEKEPIAGDLEGYLAQIEQHKVLQNNLELEQVKVNSLTHMVVVVDENSGESATAALEEQLQSLGERWAAVCRWTEERWNKLEEIQLVWQRLLDDQSLFGSWLAEKEKALSEVQTSDFKDPSEINASVRRLANLKEDMAQKRRALSALSDAGQDVMVLLNSPAAAQRIETDTDLLTQRWDNLVQKLEDCSSQVTEAVSVTAIPQVPEKVVMDTVTTVTTRMEQKPSPAAIESCRHLPHLKDDIWIQTASSGDSETDVRKLLSRLAAWKSSARAAGDTPALKEKLQTLRVELAENEGDSERRGAVRREDD
ncbi:utrophin-like [Cyprinus carpio]|uniref:Utrophin-like n=1 Tax=Cyprinus carpio TaxID=7962 RepID=A0A9Q9VRK4_CYPCA|nr:utrophin-like [Cyprinus carpio]